MAWFGPRVVVLPLVPAKVVAVCAMFRAGGYRSVENYSSRIKDLHIGECFDWSMYLERAFRESQRAVNRGIGPARQSAALDLEAAFKALDDRTCALVCDRGLVGLRKFDRGWLLLDVEGIGNQLCEGLPFGGGMDWTLPVSKTDVRAFSRCDAGSACALLT